MNNLTFVIFAFNEEKRIGYVIRNLIKYWKVIIIDNFSTDKTQEIAENLGAEVFQYQNNGYVETPEELAFVQSKVTTEYMSWSFADEMWWKELLEKTVEITRQSKHDGIATVLKNYHYGIRDLTFMTYSVKWKKHSRHVHVIKKNQLECTGMIHRSLKFNCTNIYYMPLDEKYYIHHLSTYNVKKFEQGYMKYADIEADLRFQAGERSSFLKMFFTILVYFFMYYFWHGAWRSGKPWLIMVVQFMIYRFNTWARIWELENGVTIQSIEKNYDLIREDILKKIESQ